MTSTTTARRTARATRHAALATGVVLAVCAVLGGLSLASYRSTVGELRELTARSTGTVTGAAAGEVTVEWARSPRLTVPISGSLPAVGIRTEVAYDPARPAHAIIPGAAVLTDADRSRDGVLFTALVAALVLLTDAWLLITRKQAARRPPSDLMVRRISMRSGLLARTWLETEIRRSGGTRDDPRGATGSTRQDLSARWSSGGPMAWIPVYFEPAALMLPAPATVTVHGDPTRHRLVAIDLPGGGRLHPSGRVCRTEPAGRRTDSPTQPDAYTEARATAASRWRRQLRVDAALAVPAPLIGVLWAYLDDGGITGWLGATVLAAAAALWWAAIRGSDPA